MVISFSSKSDSKVADTINKSRAKYLQKIVLETARGASTDTICQIQVGGNLQELRDLMIDRDDETIIYAGEGQDRAVFILGERFTSAGVMKHTLIISSSAAKYITTSPDGLSDQSDVFKFSRSEVMCELSFVLWLAYSRKVNHEAGLSNIVRPYGKTVLQDRRNRAYQMWCVYYAAKSAASDIQSYVHSLDLHRELYSYHDRMIAYCNGNVSMYDMLSKYWLTQGRALTSLAMLIGHEQANDDDVCDIKGLCDSKTEDPAETLPRLVDLFAMGFRNIQNSFPSCCTEDLFDDIVCAVGKMDEYLSVKPTDTPNGVYWHIQPHPIVKAIERAINQAKK